MSEPQNDLWSFLEHVIAKLAEDERPYFGDNQCMSFEDLQAGRTYIFIHGANRRVTAITLQSDVYQDERNVWRVDYEAASTLFPYENYSSSLALCDIGIIPYSNGQWAENNHLCWVD